MKIAINGLYYAHIYSTNDKKTGITYLDICGAHGLPVAPCVGPFKHRVEAEKWLDSVKPVWDQVCMWIFGYVKETPKPVIGGMGEEGFKSLEETKKDDWNNKS